MLFFPFCPLSRKEKEIKNLCALCVSNERSEWAVKNKIKGARHEI